MNISELFIRRPVMTTLVMLGIFLVGVMAFRLLPVSELPNVDFPTIQVGASLPGASPETMASSVATPLERQFSTIAGIDSMTSTSRLGSTQITIQFSLARNIDAAAADVQAAISRAQSQLPREMPSPPTYSKVNPADQPVMYIALTSPTLPMYTVNEYGQTMMAQRISMVDGVAQVMVYGSQKYAVRIQLDPHQLATRGIGIDAVAQAVSNANVNLPTGTLWGPHTAFTIDTKGQLEDAAAYRPIIVAYRNGSPVRLDELGRVINSVENDKTAAWYIDQRSVVLAVQRQPGTNTVAVADAVRELLPTFERQLPAAVSLHILYDRSQSIKESAHDVEYTLLFTLFLVVLVIFIFLRNTSATLIPSLSMPMSLAGTFAVMYLLGYSLDNLSLMALVLSLGFVVDDAIVMLENIVRHMEMGVRPFKAALEGSREISFTIVAMTLSLAAVFIPVLFMGGIVGRLFREFAVTIGTAVLISGFVSLTLTPMLSSRFLRPPQESGHGRLYLLAERIFDGMLSGYARGLRWSLDHRLVILALAFVITIGTGYLFTVVPKGFIPSQDTGQIFAFTEAAQGVSFEQMADLQQKVAAIVAKDPNIAAFMSAAGAGGIGGTNTGVLFMRLKPRNQRPPVDAIIAELRPKVAEVPGIRVFLQNLPAIRIGGRLTRSQYQVTLQSTDTDTLYRVAPILESKLRSLPGLLDVTSDLQLSNPQVQVNIDRDQASAVGVTANAIEEALYTAYGARQVSTIYAPSNEYEVILELARPYQLDPAALGMLYVGSSSGALVPLDAVASFKRATGPLSINHTGQLPSVTLSFNLEPGVSLGSAVTDVDREARAVLPDTVTSSFSGTAQAFESSFAGMGLLLMMAIFVIYIVLGILYESFIHPVTILSALPLAGFGALLTLLLFGRELDVYSFVGIIMLVGLVKKNGIIMIDFAIAAERDKEVSATEAIYEACQVRFRPIMMTTMAAFFGVLPIAIAIGAGSEARQPLGLAVAGGLIFSQLLTLFITPVVYVYMDRFQRALRRWLPFAGRGEGAVAEA